MDIGALDVNVALGIGEHRANVPLEAVLDVRLLAVITHGHRQEVEHEVRVVLILIGAHEAAALEVGGSNRALVGQQPLQAHERPAPLIQVRLGGRGGLGGLILDVDLEVVLQVLAHTWQVLDDVNSVLLQNLTVTNAGDFQQLRGVNGTGGQHDLFGINAVNAALPLVLDADGLLALEEDLGGESAGADLEVLAIHIGVEVSAGSGPALAVLNITVERSEALLAVTVDVIGQVVAGFLHRLEQGLEELGGSRTAGEVQRAIVATARVIRLGRSGGFHAVEVRQAVGKVPVLHARVLAPLLIVHRVTALVDHAVDGGRSTKDLAASMVDAAAVHLRLRIGLVHPVIVLCTDWERETGWHVNEQIPQGIWAASLKDQHAGVLVFGQACGDDGACGATANDDYVAYFIGDLFSGALFGQLVHKTHKSPSFCEIFHTSRLPHRK